MAIDFGRSFSIREFASKMRSVDVEKSWPFVRAGDELPKEEKERLLPPITYKKFRWWGDELKAATSEKPEIECSRKEAPDDARSGLGAEGFGTDEDPSVKICPVCETFTASTINAVSAHIDSCLSQASKEERRKAKTRAPKKRSIVEIFAVAPQIERQDDDEEDGEEGEEEEGRFGGEEEDADGVNVFLEDGSKVNKRKRKVKKRKDLMGTIAQKNKKKRKKNKLKIKKNLLKKKIMKKKKMKQHSSGILAFSNRLSTEKEDIQKLKMPSSIDCCEPQQGSFQTKRLGKEVTNPIDIQKKKISKFQGLAKKDPQKVKDSKSVANLWEETHVLPLQNILKNQAGVSSILMSSSACGSLNGNPKKHRRDQHSDKRVRFSGKDDILGHKKKPCTSIELPQVQCLSKIGPDVAADSSTKDQSVAGDSHSTEVNENEKYDALSVVGASEEVYSHEKRQLTNVQVPLHCHDKEKTFLEESVDLNQAVQQYDGLHQLNPEVSISYNPSSTSTLFSPILKGVTCQMGTPEEGNMHKRINTSRNFPGQSIFPAARPAIFNSPSNPTRNPSSQPLLPCLANEQEPIEKQRYPLQAIERQDHIDWGLQNRPLSHISPNDTIDSIHSTSTELTKQFASKNGPFGAKRVVSDSMSICRDKSTDDDFIGLPLNSQGEFVQIHSSGRPGFNQLFKKQHTGMASVGSLQVHNVLGVKSTMGHSNMKEKFHTGPTFPNLKWFPEGSYLKEIPAKFPIPSRSTSFQGIRRSEALCPNVMRERVQSVPHLGLEMNLVSFSSSAYGEYKESHRYSEQEKVQAQENLGSGIEPMAQPTMRLMGKNVTVGISNKECHGSEDGRIWIDKEIITEHPTSTISGISLAKKFKQPELVIHNTAGTSNESEICFMDAPSTLQVTAMGTRPAQTNLNHQTHVMLMNGLPLVDGNHSSDLDPLGEHIPSQSVLHRSPNIPENCLSRAEAFKISNRIPFSLSNPHGRHIQHMLLSSAQCKHNQSLTCGATLPFSDEDRRQYLPTSRAQRSSPSLPPWLQNATELKEIPYTPLAHSSSPNSKHELCTMSGTDFLRRPLNLTPISFSSHSSNTYPGLPNSCTPLTHNPLIPAFPGFNSVSSISTSFRNWTMGDKTNAKSTYKGLDVAQKAKKRPAAKADEIMKTTKKPNLAIQEEANASAGPQKGEYLHGYTRYNTGSAAFHDQGDKPDIGVEKDELRTASGTSALKLDAVARSGPIKLSAGAKHILKPSQNMDQDSSRPTHSTIPFAIVADSGKLPEIQRKTAKIYRF